MRPPDAIAVLQMQKTLTRLRPAQAGSGFEPRERWIAGVDLV